MERDPGFKMCKEEMVEKDTGVTNYCGEGDYPVSFAFEPSNGKYVIYVESEGGYAWSKIDAKELLKFLEEYRLVINGVTR